MGGRVVDADGTQAPEPPKPFSDPLGGAPEGGAAGRADGAAASGEVAKPVEVDREAARQLATVLAEQNARAPAGAGPDAGPDADDEPTAEIPPQKAGVRASRPALLAPILRRRGPTGGVVRRGGRAAPRMRRPSSGAAGFAVALTLMLIFLLIAIQFVASFVESVTGIFG
ncbi:hypothetical protein [Saccharomonospora xinjiangensis]|uniref:hypothetical protein n=1 Tax=Saccharomonospora xinjiangensis TaxID=75294 RepID=UPI001E3D6359|nr:hypothetical protein [Saccharomonospora xinjiangensis]